MPAHGPDERNYGLMQYKIHIGRWRATRRRRDARCMLMALFPVHCFYMCANLPCRAGRWDFDFVQIRYAVVECPDRAAPGLRCLAV
jgi:hypothetical protein